MFLTDCVDESGPALGRYRAALQDAFDPRTFARFYSDEIGEVLEHEVDAHADFVTLLQRTLERCRQDGARLRRLLVRALRHRAARAPLVEVLAPALCLGPVVEVAGLLADHGCPATLREHVAKAVDDTCGAHRTVLQRHGRAAWIDVLVWLEELPDGARARPLLIDYLERIEHDWRATGERGAAELGRWLDAQRRAYGIAPPAIGAATPSMQGVLLDFIDQGTVWTFVAYLFGGERLTMLFSDTLAAPSTGDDLCAAIARVVDRCLTDRAVVPLLIAGAELRFELVLPNPWIWLPVDQIEIGDHADEDVEPTRLGASHPVVVRPRSWWRPTPGRSAYATILRRFNAKRAYQRRHEDGKILELDCPTQWTRDQLAWINESPDVIGIALVCDRTTTGNPDRLRCCLRAHVLAIMWKRSGIAAGDAAEGARLGSLLERIEDAPRRVHRERRDRGADLSLIWHVDPIEPPEHEPFGAPEIAR